MITFEELVKQKPVFLHKWSNAKDVAVDFEEDIKVNILFASYNVNWCEGDAFVLFEDKGKLYEVNASHCSYYGFKGQWQPEETTIYDLIFRLHNGTLGRDEDYGNLFYKELCDFLQWYPN